MIIRNALLAGLVALGLPLAAAPARAEVTEVRLAQQFAFTYLHLNVIKHQKLIEKHAAALGVPNLKVTLNVFNGPDAMNDAILSGAVDLVCGGVPALLYIWDRTKGTPQEIRGVSAMGYFDLHLNTRAAHIKSIEDFLDNDKIAVPAVKVSGQALILQMAAAKKWGIANWEKLDRLTFAVASPDMAAAMLANNPAFETAYSSPPFTFMMMKNQNVRTILKSSEIVGNATSALWYTSKRFHDNNPKVYQAIVNAVKEAQTFIEKDLRTAVTYYLEDTGAKTGPDDIVNMLKNPGLGYHVAPNNTMLYADFLHQIGRLKNKPASWKDYFWPEIYDLQGS